VTVSGTSFGASRGASTMDFNGTEAAAYTSWGDTQAVLAAPSGGSTGPVSLSKDGAPPLRSSPLDFRYAPCALFALQLPYNATGGATGWFKVDDPGAATSLGGGNTLTVEAWVRPTLLPAGDMFVVYKESQYAMTVQNGIFKARVYNSAGWTAWQGAAPVTIDAWSHVAFSYDGTSLRTFVNGSLSTTTAVTCCVGHSGYTFYVGSNTGSGPFYGEIDEVRASKAVRYNASFTRPAAWFTNDSNTSGLWHFNDGESSTTAADSSGNNNTLSNGAGSAAQIWPSRAPFACP
jgi:hypothetical protein